MQHAPSCPPFGTPGVEENPSFNVVIVYEDFETGKHARKTYDFLVENLGCDCRFINQMWKFDVLKIAKLRDIAAKDAVVADIVIISSHGSHELPPEVREWIESWLADPGETLALVALFDRPEEKSEKMCEIRDYLASVAKRGRMKFFSQPHEWSSGEREPERFMLQRVSNLGGRTLSTLAGAVEREPSVSDWGLNE
jgi:hypothetical protein